MGKTVSEKIIAKASGRKYVESGDFVVADVDVAMIPDLTTVLAFEAMSKSGMTQVWDPDKIVLILDHMAPASSLNSAEIHKTVRNFVAEQGINNFYDVESGVCHQVLAEKGYVKPGKVVIGADSHTCTHGAFGAFATGVGSTDMGGILATGKTWLKAPKTIRVNINGRLPSDVHPKDIILKICGEVGASGATYMALEFHGSTVSNMSVSGRMTLCNMAIEMGGKTGIVEPDEKTYSYLKERVEQEFSPVFADEDASYEKIVEVDSGELEPMIACPHNVDNVKPISEVGEVKIHQAFIGSCTNGRLEDLQVAHELLKGRKIHRDVRLLIVPASREVYRAALEMGILKDLLDTGAIISNPSCGACFGGHIGILASSETGITTSNRNFRGRQGSPESMVYLSSPAVAASSSLKGYITHPKEV